MKTFRQDLEELINKHSMENGSNTPDFILADYLTSCLRTFDRILKQRDQWYDKKLTRNLVDQDKDDQEKIIDELKSKYLSDKKTQCLGKRIGEVQDEQFMERIEDSYAFMNNILLGTILPPSSVPMNTKDTREWVQKTLEGRLKKFGVVVKCDEENNPPDVIDQNLLIARLMRTKYDKSPGYTFMDLIFGKEENVRKYHAQNYFENAIFSYIGKGM